MKYSFLLPYCKRDSFESSLISFLHHYSERKDYEIVLIEDISNHEDQGHHDNLLNIIKKYESLINMVYCFDDYRSYNSAKKYNIGFGKSTGEFLILSNPETFHKENVLKGLDEEFSKDPGVYVMCSCQAVHFNNPVIASFDDYNKCRWDMWYQHSQHNNRMLHFCSAISRENFLKVGGFDERYCRGIAYEDDSLRERIRLNNIPLIYRDDLITLHIEHSRQYLYDNKVLHDLNRDLYRNQQITNDFFEKFI